MASTSGTASASTSANADAADDDRNKTVTGYPVQSLIVTGYPHIPPPERASRIVATFYNTHVDTHHSSPHLPPATILFRVICAIFTAGLVLISGFIIFWLLLRPHFPEIEITSASISSLNATYPNSPFAAWNLSILVKNPNQKLTLSYDRLQAFIAYDNYLLSQAELPPFRQLNLSQTQVRAELDVIEANVRHGLVGEILNWRARGMVEFEVRLIASVRFRTGHWWFRSHLMVVYCPGLYLGFSPANPNGTLLNPNKQCSVAV